MFSPAGKLLLMGAMILGRLEIYPVLSALMPSFWLRRTRPRLAIGQVAERES